MSFVIRKFGWAYGSVSIILFLACSLHAAPTPVDNTGNAQGNLPGTFPTSVTAANLNIQQGTPATMNGTGQNLIHVDFPAAGPIKWTESRANEGDYSLLMGPGDPNDPAYYPPTGFFDNYRPLAGDPAFAKTTIGWRATQQTGALLATVRHNGVDYGSDYTFGGNPVGKIHGIAYFNQTAAQGWGYSMVDGTFGNGGTGASDLQIGMAGFDNAQGESNSSAAVAYFPYEQGWKGAWVNGINDGAATFAASSPGLPTSSVNWSGGVATVSLSGVNSATDGMLFVAPTHDDNNTNIAAAFPTGGGWNVAVREDDAVELSGVTLAGGVQNGFQFLYVPYSAPRLIGGQVNGADASLIHSANDAFFDVARTAEGKYAISVYGANGITKLGENDGMLVLSVAQSITGSTTLADRKFLSYQYNSGTGNFDVESREDVAISSPNTENQFGDDLALRDSTFYFAWVSFTNPVAPQLTADYNNDGKVDAGDYATWRKNVGTTNALANDPIGGTIGSAQFNQWRANFGLSNSPGAGAGAGLVGGGSVPEPSSLAALLLSFGLALTRIRVRRRGCCRLHD